MFGKEKRPGDVIYDYAPDPYAMQPPMPMMPMSGTDMETAEQMREERIANVIAQINPATLIEDMEHRLKGERKDFSKGGWVKINKDSVEVSPELLADTIGYCSSLLEQNTSLTNLSSAQINNIIRTIIKYVVDKLDEKADAYGFGEDYTERTRIAHIIVAPIFFVLCRAENGMEARRIFSALKVNETLNAMQPQKKSFLDNLKFWN